jgi:predicted O-methyltransferase YrrM
LLDITSSNHSFLNRKIINEPNWFNYSSFYSFVADQNFNVLVELGVFFGLSISFLAQEHKAKNNGVKIYGVDLFDTWAGKEEIESLYDTKGLSDEERLKKLGEYKYNFVTNRLEEIGCKHFVELIKSDSCSAASLFENESVDFVFIDGDHRYDYVKKDIESWLPKIKKGGIVSGHDYQEKGVSAAVEEIFGHSAQVFEKSRSCWYVHI